MSQKRQANPHFLCPKCGRSKGYHSTYCFRCSSPTTVHAKPGDRKLDLIKRIASGETTKEIGFNLGISAKTVEGHWAKAKAEFGFQCVQDATKYAIKNHLITI